MSTFQTIERVRSFLMQSVLEQIQQDSFQQGGKLGFSLLSQPISDPERVRRQTSSNDLATYRKFPPASSQGSPRTWEAMDISEGNGGLESARGLEADPCDEVPAREVTGAAAEAGSAGAGLAASTSSAAEAEGAPLGTGQAEPPRLGSRGWDVARDLVGRYMSHNPVCLDKNMTLLQAVRVMLQHGISGAPVVERFEGDSTGSGRLVGVLSEEDLLWKEVEANEKGISETFREPYLWSLMASDSVMMEAVENQALKVLSNTVGLSMSAMSISVSPETPMSEAASIMLDAKVKRLPVVAPREGARPGMTVVGIITRKDMLRHVMTLLEEEAGRGAAPGA